MSNKNSVEPVEAPVEVPSPAEAPAPAEAPPPPEAEKTVKIKLPRKKGEPALYVSINERSWMIKRGMEVEVPACVAELIRNSERMQDEADAFIEARGSEE